MLEQMFEEFEQTIGLMLKELRKINAKADLTKEEICAIKEMAEAIYKMEIAEAMYEDGSESEYYDDDMRMSNRGRSYARGRDMRTGRYVSRFSSPRRYDMDHVSGHSLHDRMIAKLEGMIDSSNSDYEKKTIEDWIHKIRMDEDKQ